MKFDDARGNGGETPAFNTLLDTSMEELRVKTVGHQVAQLAAFEEARRFLGGKLKLLSSPGT